MTFFSPRKWEGYSPLTNPLRGGQTAGGNSHSDSADSSRQPDSESNQTGRLTSTPTQTALQNVRPPPWRCSGPVPRRGEKSPPCKRQAVPCAVTELAESAKSIRWSLEQTQVFLNKRHLRRATHASRSPPCFSASTKDQGTFSVRQPGFSARENKLKVLPVR